MDKLTLTDFEDDTLIAEPFGFTLATGKLYVGIAKHDRDHATGVVLDRNDVARLARHLITWLEEAPK